MKRLENEIIAWGQRLFDRRLISGWGGNISCRAGKERFLITGQHAPLGFLKAKDLVYIDGQAKPLKKGSRPSSETALHLANYKNNDAEVVIHVHPPRVLVYSLNHKFFSPLSYEEKFTIGEIPILPQETPTVTATAAVVEELKLRPVVILQGHGTVAVGKNLEEAFLYTDLLEEAVYCQMMKEGESASSPPEEKTVTQEASGERHELFSVAHIMSLIQAANADESFRKEAQAKNLKTSVTLAVEEDKTAFTFHFSAGSITGFRDENGGEFIFSGKRQWWEAIFNGRIDPFLATQQGKLKLLHGEMWQLSQWFKPFERMFQIWQRVPVK